MYNDRLKSLSMKTKIKVILK